MTWRRDPQTMAVPVATVQHWARVQTRKRGANWSCADIERRAIVGNQCWGFLELTSKAVSSWCWAAVELGVTGNAARMLNTIVSAAVSKAAGVMATRDEWAVYLQCSPRSVYNYQRALAALNLVHIEPTWQPNPSGPGSVRGPLLIYPADKLGDYIRAGAAWRSNKRRKREPLIRRVRKRANEQVAELRRKREDSLAARPCTTHTRCGRIRGREYVTKTASGPVRGTGPSPRSEPRPNSGPPGASATGRVDRGRRACERTGATAAGHVVVGASPGGSSRDARRPPSYRQNLPSSPPPSRGTLPSSPTGEDGAKEHSLNASYRHATATADGELEATTNASTGPLGRFPRAGPATSSSDRPASPCHGVAPVAKNREDDLHSCFANDVRLRSTIAELLAVIRQ